MRCTYVYMYGPVTYFSKYFFLLKRCLDQIVRILTNFTDDEVNDYISF